MNITRQEGLRQQQQAFQAALLGQPVGGLLRPGPGGAAASLAVYRHAHAARLAAALRDNFEILARALGDKAFAALASAYIDAQPSDQPSIRWFGHRLAGFMDQRLAADDGLVPHPALADLARMDWALRGAFDAADAPVLLRDALAAVPPEHWPGLRLVLHPSVQQVALQWAVEAAWHALRAGVDGADVGADVGADGNPTDSGPEPELPAPEAHPHALLVWRRGLATQWRSLAGPEAALLQSVADGAVFGDLCEQAASAVDKPDQAVAQVVAALQQWLADGLVSSFSVSA